MGCECDCKCGTEKVCCPSLNGQMMAYNSSGRLKVQVGTPVYECNSKCTCSTECNNRVVQRGRKVNNVSSTRLIRV